MIQMRLIGANVSAKAEGLDELPGRSNYFIGNDPSQWRANVPNYARVQYSQVYKGIDLTYYAVSIVGPRNRVDKLVGTLPLLGGSLGVRR